MKWTEEQYQAIMKQGSNIIVSAGAGSGKTAVLSERVLRKVKEGVDIRDILILTFTNEAAGEMKNRIREKIAKAGLTEQLEYIDAAYITTFDAYALAMVKKYHYLLNVSKNIAIIDSSIIDLERKKQVNEIFLEMYEKKDKDFLKLVDDFTTRSDEAIMEAVISISNSLDLKYDKKEFLESYGAEFYDWEYIDKLFLEYFHYIKGLCLEVEDIISVLEGMVDEALYIKLYDAYSPLFKPRKYDDIYIVKMVSTVQFRGVDEEVIPLKERLKVLKEEILELTKYSEEELKEQVMSTKEYVQAFIKIILELDKRLDQYKFKYEAFEFSDIAKMAIKIVQEHQDIREELKWAYNEILIDEYQDTNDLQEMFISSIENDNVYMVGDIKQSIYRFRNANPGIFKTKYDNYSVSLGGEKIDLLKNFRSRREVLDNINEIFNLIMTEEIGGVNYQNNHAMVYGNMAYINEGANNNDNNMEIWKYDNEEKKFSNVEIEAFAIGRDIEKKVEEKYQVFDFKLGSNRDIKYSDFCIILDRGTDMPIYKKIFEYLSIPMDVYKDNDLVMASDVLIIKNIINLALLIKEKEFGKKMRYLYTSVARSFVGGMSDVEISESLGQNEFYTSEVYRKCQEIARNIDMVTPRMVLENIIDSFEIYQKLITVGDVSQALIRLEYLLNLSSSVTSLGFTVKDFGEYLETMVSERQEIRYKEVRGVGNCVKIMNIHKSKGLEFPVCYFAGFKRDFNLRDLQSRFSFDNKYGIITPFYKEGIGTLFTKTLVKNKYYIEEISEKIRLFYVALTRAKEKMIMVMPSFKKEGQAQGTVDRSVASQYRSFHDFISSIARNLARYTKGLSLDCLGLSHDYQFVSVNNREIEKSDEVMVFKKILVDTNLIEKHRASKEIKKVLPKEELRAIEFGTRVHEMLELTDFKNYRGDNKYILNLMEQLDFKDAIVYQELEFMYNKENGVYQGVIDLMLEYDSDIKIIDYKLKNISDDAYKRQLNAYYEYVRSISDKRIRLYLYSVLEGKLEEVDVKVMINS